MASEVPLQSQRPKLTKLLGNKYRSNYIRRLPPCLGKRVDNMMGRSAV